VTEFVAFAAAKRHWRELRAAAVAGRTWNRQRQTGHVNLRFGAAIADPLKRNDEVGTRIAMQRLLNGSGVTQLSAKREAEPQRAERFRP